MENLAAGTFEVKVTSVGGGENQDPDLGRMIIDKQFHGDLEATSKGQMLSAGSVVKGSAGYVAMEKVSGTLKGLTGSFALQHSGSIARGTQQMSVNVVPDSGTGELAGLFGYMEIIIENGKHSYKFTYNFQGQLKG